MSGDTVISPKQCLAKIDEIFVELAVEAGLVKEGPIAQARAMQARYAKQKEHASIADILMYEGLLQRRQIDDLLGRTGDQVWGCVDCNTIARYPGGKPATCGECGGEVYRVFRPPFGEIDPGQAARRFVRGAKLGRYTLVEAIGSGAMGRVFRAESDDGTLVAMKVLAPEDGVTWEDVKRFQHEVRSMGDLSHEHVMSISDHGLADGCHYYCMELVQGVSLSRKIDQGPIPFEDAMRIGAQLASALDHVHSRGVVHRDLKPDNVMFDEEGNPRILDFGIAKNALQTTQVTEYGTALGTPAYMSPEQARGEIHKVGAKTDIYALGVLLYEMTTGNIPFHDEHDVNRLLDKIEADDPQRPTELNPDIPPEFEAVIMRAMAKQPDQRYPTAGHLAADLRALAEGKAPGNLTSSGEGLFTRLVRRLRGDQQP